MKKIKKIFAIILTSAILLTALCFAACSCDGEKIPDGGEITLNKYSLTLDINEEAKLLADVGDESAVFVWASSDEKVATVTQEGVVRGETAGNAEITVTCGESSAKCAVTVTDGGKLPLLKLNGGEESVSLMMGSSFTVLPKLKYNGEDISDAVYTYASNNEEVLTVDKDGVITGRKIGEATVQVKAEWKHFTVYQTLTIKFVPATYVSAEDSVITIYSSDKFGDAIEATVSLKVYKDGDEIENPTIRYEYDGAALNITNDKVSAKKYADEEYPVTAYWGEGEEEISAEFTVKVVRPVGDKHSSTNYNLEAMADNAASVINCFDDGSNVVEVYDTEDLTDNRIENGKLKLNAKYYKDREWVVYSDNGYGYKVKGSVITKRISTADEFAEIFLKKSGETSGWTEPDNIGAASETYYDGWYVLESDIEFSITSYTDCKYKAFYVGGNDGVPDNAGFNGIFDGQGHTVSNLWLSNSGCSYGINSGIFGTIGKNGVVKNVAFVGGGGSNMLVGYFANSIAGTVSNVYIDLDLATNDTDSANRDEFGVLAYRVLPTASISNVVTYLSGSTRVADKVGKACSFVRRLDAGASISNCYTVVAENNFVTDAKTYTSDGKIKVYTKAQTNAVSVNASGFESSYWDLTANLLPVMKSSLNFYANKVSFSTDSNYVASGEKTFNISNFEYRTLSVVSQKGTIEDGGDGAGQLDKEYKLTLGAGDSGDFNVYLKFCGRTVQTLEMFTQAPTAVNVEYFALKETDGEGNIVNKDYTYSGIADSTINSVTLGGVAISSDNYTFVGGTLTVKNAAFVEHAGYERTLMIASNSGRIAVTFGKIATFAITKASDVNSGNGSVPAWMKACGLTNDLKSNGNYMKYDGYVVVANDIDFKSAILNNKVMCHNATGVWNVGFGGTFDGMGHSLKNFTVKGTNTSFFGNLNFGSVVKDVKFIDFTVDGYACFGLFDSQCYATIQNVTIECTYSNPYDSNGAKPKNAAALGNFSYYGEWKKGASLIDCDITVHAGEGFDGKDLSGVYGVMGEGSAFTSTAGSTIKTNFKVPASFTSGGGTVSQLITETKTESWFAQKQTNASGEIVNNNYTISGLTGGKVIKVLLNGEIVSESYYSYSGGTFTIQGAAFTCYGDNRTLSVFTDKDGVAVTFGKVASFAITKASDINSESGTFAPWASALGLNALNGVSYGGYVILTCNIDFAGATINNLVPCTNGGDSSCFVGTFDGCGYTLKNFTVSGINTSFFGVIGSVGVIKNVNFTGFTVDGYACFGLFDSEFSGTIDNCTISGTYNNSKSGTSQLGSLLGTFNNSSKLTNCTITVTVGDGAEASDYGALKARNYGSTLATNVIITGTTITTDFALHDAFASAKQTTTEE